MIKQTIVLTSMLLSFSLTATADQTTPSVSWPTRNSKVICGGSVDKESLKLRVVLPNELLAAESPNGRALIYIELHKPGQIHLAISEAITDQDYTNREEALKKLTLDEATLIRAMTANRAMNFHFGLTDGYVNLQFQFGERSMSISCQEIALTGLLN